MLKALLKKQFLELNSFYFQDKKTGKIRSKGAVVGFIALFAFVFFSIAASVFSMGFLFADSFLPLGLDWLYFALMGLFSVTLGVFGDVFNTYASLYLAKDNNLLLSMPIPTSKILFARMTGVYAMGILYESLVFLPAIIVYWIRAELSVQSILYPVVLWLLVGLIVLVLTCILGYVVAVVSTKLKSKAFFTALLGFLIFAIYYVAYFKINTMLQSVAQNAEKVGDAIQRYVYPFYAFGLAGSGNGKALLAVIAAVLSVFALTYWVLSKSFIRIATAKTGSKKSEYKEKNVKFESVNTALLKKEFKRFTGSPAYMLNCGLGLIVLLGIGVFSIVKADTIRETAAGVLSEYPEVQGLIAPLVSAAVCLVLSMNAFTAPSISLEGKNLWILQSLPVNPKAVLSAKERMHILLNLVPAIICVVCLNLVFSTGLLNVLLSVLLVVVFIIMSADFGLMMGIRKPNLVWTNENVPVKQSMSVVVTLFSGWGFSILMIGFSYLMFAFLNVQIGMLILSVLMAVIVLTLKKWIYGRGVEIFSAL